MKSCQVKVLGSRFPVHAIISNTTTKSGLRIGAEVDNNKYEKGIKVSDAEMNQLNIKRENFHGEWNYKIMPQKRGRFLS